MTLKTTSALSLADRTEGGVASARRVLRLEAAGIDALSRSLDETFVNALDVLTQVTGRVIVTGMGKSGHVARKMAATLASTGTPASFVHPAEASHGDLGMITHHDAVIAFSNSGETPELADLVNFAKLHEIPLVGITGRAASTLAAAADVTLVLPDTPEACPMGLAPTTSTTVMLALADAIAVAMLERKGFSADDFHVLHPGGKLGRRLLRVGTIMHSGEALPLATVETKMTEVVLVMSSKGFGCVGIIGDDGRLAGIITDGDLRRHMGSNLLELSAAEVMTPNPKAIRPDALASEALGFMNSRSITNLFVVEDRRPVGIVHVHDCLRADVA
ncbi:MAG: KpsF/GutQ family sugar-phosphate isomerase [Rhodospirillales bacterium]|nr:KpsF/GutQ family sugar-phosphate isomerase [Rhodospirillales bacterium]